MQIAVNFFIDDFKYYFRDTYLGLGDALLGICGQHCNCFGGDTAGVNGSRDQTTM